MENIGELVKKLRKEHGYTLKDLSQKLNLSVGFLSQFERGVTTIAVEHLVKIATLFNVPINHFFTQSPAPEETIVRSYDQKVMRIINDTVYKSLSPHPQDKQMMPKLIEMLPASTNEHVTTYPHEGEEFVYVLAGILTLIINGAEQQLYPGDSAHYASSQPHNWANYTNIVVKFLVLHTPNDY
ncbi:helix-turn-helix transcriptional regulator [Vagococcus sp. BWB3-3]|uniref:Helix-turn-helix transcriptional regulator n=1 Tax=Vagococcus allomyrinae TaxID=2794353 RepID=A0A940PAD1_9ENTE|nr:XRE family transcriptional regulator [Vagococcus allomyrinae]MBP1042541.1 helix-turn-helix transcriptional regulator [Vagococcus allomyrinae]